MYYWLIIMVVLLALTIGGTVFLVKCVHRFGFIQKLSKGGKLLPWIISVLFVALVIVGFGMINYFTSIVVVLHLLAAWLIGDLVLFMVKKFGKKEISRNIEGIAVIAVTILYLGVGWYNAHNVRRTEYTFNTEKGIGSEPLKVVCFADSHLGITLDGEKFTAEMERIQAENPDVVLVAGDFVDDDSCRADMIEACKALGNLKTTYGVYFIYGNHDKGYYESYRDFEYYELVEELIRNDVTVLEDESVLVDDKFYIIGRRDKSEPERAEMSQLTEKLDASKLMVVMDHQPNDYANEAETPVDLVVSGHTHGGHIFPAGIIGLITKANDRVYGTEVRNNTNFMVSSGISGWAIPFKTGTFSEYVVINIK